MAPATRTSGPPPATVVVPDVVLTWQDLLLVADPTRQPTQARLRHLRQAGHVSPGVVVVRRSERRVAGKSTFFSALWAWSLRMRRQERLAEAKRLESAARRVEERFATPLAEFLSSRSLDDLREAPFFTNLAAATAKALAAVPRVLDAVAVSGTVADLQAPFGRVEGRSPSGDRTVVDLPSSLFESAGLASGDLVWVLSRVVGHAALVEVVHAESTWLPNAPPALRWAIDERAGDDDEEFWAAARYDQGPAARPSAEYVESVLSAARSGALPTRTLRLAG